MAEELAGQAEQLQSTIAFFRTQTLDERDGRKPEISFSENGGRAVARPAAHTIAAKTRVPNSIHAQAPVPTGGGVKISLEETPKADELDSQFVKYD